MLPKRTCNDTSGVKICDRFNFSLQEQTCESAESSAYGVPQEGSAPAPDATLAVRSGLRLKVITNVNIKIPKVSTWRHDRCDGSIPRRCKCRDLFEVVSSLADRQNRSG